MPVKREEDGIFNHRGTEIFSQSSQRLIIKHIKFCPQRRFAYQSAQSPYPPNTFSNASTNFSLLEKRACANAGGRKGDGIFNRRGTEIFSQSSQSFDN